MARRHAEPDWWQTGTLDGRPLREYLREHDITAIFRFLKARGWSRAAIAAATGLSESRVREIVHRRQRVTSYEVLERIANGLAIDRPLLGLGLASEPGRATDTATTVANARGQVTQARPLLVDPGLPAHWYSMLRVLAAADNFLGGHGLLDVIHTEAVLIDRHRQASRNRLRGELTAVLARWLEFGSWIADNQQQNETAERWLRTAGSLADEAGDSVHAAYVQMRQAQRAVEAGDAGGAAGLAEPIMRDIGLPPRVRALAAVRLAQALAGEHDPTGARASLGVAYHLVDQATLSEEPAVTAMAGHGTSAYLRGYEAYCRLLLGEPEAAIRDLRLVLADWPANQRLDEGLFRAHLAVALDRAGQRDAAQTETATAKTLALQTGSRRTLAALEAVAVSRFRSNDRAGRPLTR